MNYRISEDLSFILEAEKKNLDEFSKASQISRNTLYSITKNVTVSPIIHEKFYSYVYRSKYRLNSVKEDLLKESKKGSVLFHGSKCRLTEIQASGSRSSCDFGRGFYLGETYDQALSFVCENEGSCIYSFCCDIGELKILKFDCSLDWMFAICYYRGSLKEFEHTEKIAKIIENINNADLIIAPIADNRMFYIMSLFASGDINSNVASHSLSASKLGMQYVFRTERSLKRLKPKERYFLCQEEKEDCKKRLNQRAFEIDTKLKMAKREFKEGFFIEELLK